MKQQDCQSLYSGAAWQFAQRGSALITGLVFLVVLTLLGLSASSGSIQRELIARNIRDQNLALQAAEAALQAAENWARLNDNPGLVDGKLIVATNTCVAACESGDSYWWGKTGTVLGSGANQTKSFPGVAVPPAYLIEALPPPRTSMVSGTAPSTFYYRITARGTGLSPNTVRIVRSIYRI